MASNPYVNKVVYDGNTLIDLSQDTLDGAGKLLLGVTGHSSSGEAITGTADYVKTVSSVPSVKDTGIIYNSTDGKYYLWRD